LNPNEQIFVYKPMCPNNSSVPCRYTCLIRSHSFPFERLNGKIGENISQAIAVVFTTAGKVIGPTLTTIDQWPSIDEEKITDPVQVEFHKSEYEKTSPTSPFDISSETTLVIEFSSVPLSVTLNDSKCVHNVVPIATFPWSKASGLLQSVSLNLAPYSQPPVPLSGSPNALTGLDAFLLTVTVVDPNGLAVEVGGYDWPIRSDEFYLKCWPTHWTSCISPDISSTWESTRVISAAGLGRQLPPLNSTFRSDTLSSPIVLPFDSSSDRENMWTVSLSVGFKTSPRPVIYYSGKIRLGFSLNISCTQSSPHSVAEIGNEVIKEEKEAKESPYPDHSLSFPRDENLLQKKNLRQTILSRAFVVKFLCVLAIAVLLLAGASSLIDPCRKMCLRLARGQSLVFTPPNTNSTLVRRVHESTPLLTPEFPPPISLQSKELSTYQQVETESML